MLKETKGFTLIELLIVISLFGVIILLLGSLLNYNIRNFVSNDQYYQYKSDARYAINIVTSEIRKNYNTSYNSGKILDNSSNIIVNSNPNDENGSIYFYFDQNRYGTGNGYGELRRNGGGVIARNIKDFKIESDSDGIVKITIKAGKDNNDKIFELSTYITLYK
jgi:prepilin-type N-terminal cleavage/methylation domain-containing protein